MSMGNEVLDGYQSSEVLDKYPTLMLDINLIDVVDQPMPEQSEEEKKNLMNSIKEHGLVYGVVVRQDEETGRYIVKEGRTRYESVKKLGHKYIKCVLQDGDNNILPFELELCRRHLDSSKLKQYREKCEKLRVSQLHYLNGDIGKKLNPRMKTIFEGMCESGISKEWRLLFFLIAKLPQEEQDAFFNSNTIEIQEESNALIEQLQDQVEELNNRLNEAIDTKKEQDLAIEKVKKSIKNKLDQKKLELEDQYKKKNLSDEAISKIIEDERKKINEQYGTELEEQRKKMVDLSKTIKNTQDQIETLTTKLSFEESKKKEYQILAQKNMDKLKQTQQVLREFTAAPKIKNEITGLAEEIGRKYSNMVSVGSEAFNKDQIKEIIIAVGKIRDVITLMEGFFKTAVEKKTAIK